jgi:hypothetical protein
MWQQIIVALIVAAAVLHFCTKYLPAAWRQQIVYFLTRRGFDQNKLAKLFKTKSSCGDGCGSCGSCETPAPMSASASAPPSASGAQSSPSPADASAPRKRVIMLHVQR